MHSLIFCFIYHYAQTTNDHINMWIGCSVSLLSFWNNSYLWNLVNAQNIWHESTNVSIMSCNHRYYIILEVTLVVRDELSFCREKLHGSQIDPSCQDIAIGDMDTEGHIRQDLGILIDFFDCKFQSQIVLVVLHIQPEMSIRATVAKFRIWCILIYVF